ncbi:hypothetical protein [Streptomyces sp. NPDC006645]|uniref:hypothetical protein n=1 Tax=unclassified Streptomyces TaxID=2593676 RepID=UPI00339E6DCC
MEEEELNRIEEMIVDALARREGNRWNAVRFEYALNYRLGGDTQLRALKEAEDAAAKAYSVSKDNHAYRYIDPHARTAAQEMYGMRVSTSFDLVQLTGAAYASAINEHEGVREARVLSESERLLDLTRRQEELARRARRLETTDRRPAAGTSRRPVPPREEPGARGRRTQGRHGSARGAGH